jgi:hypothetical protein
MNDAKQHGDFELTPREFEQLCEEEAKLRRTGKEVERRREVIEARLRDAVKRDREERTSIIREYRTAMRQQRKAQDEEREEQRKHEHEERRSRVNPEALANLSARIAAMPEQTREQRAEAREAALAQYRQMLAQRARAKEAKRLRQELFDIANGREAQERAAVHGLIERQHNGANGAMTSKEELTAILKLRGLIKAKPPIDRRF